MNDIVKEIDNLFPKIYGVSGLLNNLNEILALDIQGVLNDKTTLTNKDNAFRWIFNNYDNIKNQVYASTIIMDEIVEAVRKMQDEAE